MTGRTVAGYLISILFIMPTTFFYMFRVIHLTIPFALIVLLGAWLVLKDANKRSIVKYVIVIGIFGVIGYFIGVYIFLLALLSGPGSP